MTPGSRGVLRQVGTLGTGTIAAAVLGVALQGLLAAWFGAGAESDAWFWSVSIYAFVAKFLMLSQFKSLALPVFVDRRATAPEAARSFIGAASTAVPALLLALAVVLLAVAPWLVDLLAPGLDDSTRDLTTLLLRIRIPALVALGLTTVGLVVVEGTGRFGRSVTAQRLLPAVGALVGLAALGSWLGIVGAAIGSIAGALLGLVAVVRPIREASTPVGLRSALRDRDLVATARGWIRFGSSNAAVFLGEWVFRIGASLLPVGYFSAVAYGRMVHDLAHGALNDAASAVGLTRFAEAARSEDDLARTVRRGTAALAGIALPIAVLLAVSADRIVDLLFGRGRFAEDGLAFVATDALRIFAVGLFLQGMNQLLFAALFAGGRGRTVNGVQLVGHLLRAAWLVPLVMALSFRGLVLAQVLMNLAVGLLLLMRVPATWRPLPGVAAAGMRLGLAGGAAAAAAWWVGGAVPPADPASLGVRLAMLLGVTLAFGVVYATVALVVRAPGVDELRMLAGRAVPGVRGGAAMLALVATATLASAGPAAAAAPGGASSAKARDPLGTAGTRIDGELRAPRTPADTVEWSAAPLPSDPALRAALRRLEALGRIPVGVSTIDLIPGRRLAWRLREAGPEGEALLRSLERRFGGETLTGDLFAGAEAGDDGAGAFAAGRLRVSAPGLPIHAWIAGRTPEADVVGPEGDGAPLDDGRIAVVREVRGGVGVELGPLLLTAARDGAQLGGHETGAIVLDRNATFDQVGLRTAWPFALPLLGETDVELAVAPEFGYDAVEDPWFVRARIEARPHPAVRIGLSRGVMFGGRFAGGSVPYDPVVYPADDRTAGFDDALRTLLGRINDFDDQVAAIDLRWALAPLGAPVTLTAEVGFEDTDRSWGDPGLQLGVEALLPDDRTMVRYAYAAFGAGARWCPGCDRLPAYWYRHVRFQDGWRTRDRFLGHPLAGYGREHRIGLERSADDGAFGLVELARLDRDRWNLLEGVRGGAAWAGRVRLDLPLSRGAYVRGAGSFEAGDAVTLWRLEAGLALRFAR